MIWQLDVINNVVEQEYRYIGDNVFKAYNRGDSVFEEHILDTDWEEGHSFHSIHGECIVKLQVVRRQTTEGIVWSIGTTDYYNKTMKIVTQWHVMLDKIFFYGIDDPDNEIPEGELIDLLIRIGETLEEAKKKIRR